MNLTPGPVVPHAPLSKGERAARVLLDGRFRLQVRLKEQHHTEIWSAVDESNLAPVLVKLMPDREASPAAWERLEHEAATMRFLDHPSIPALVYFGHLQDGRFLVTEHVEGQTLRDRLLEQGPLRLREAWMLAEQLLDVTSALHDVGCAPCDLKPASILLDESCPIERVRLVDIASTRDLERDASLEDTASLHYMSPERAGLIPAEVDGRADLYSIGAILYECLTGKPPIVGRDASALLQSLLGHTPEPLRNLGLDVPSAFEQVIARLLAKDPRERYQTADGVLEDVRLLRAALARGDGDPHLVVGLRDRRETLTQPCFVGRTETLNRLQGAVLDAAAGRTSTKAIAARSGDGKTRLLDELAAESLRRAARVFRGGGVHAVASRPFGLLTPVADGIAAVAEVDTGFGDRLRAAVEGHKETLCYVFPQLERVLGAPDLVALGPEAFGLRRTLHALTLLLEALGEPGRPCVLLLDDCQWADQATFDLLEHWQHRRVSSELRVHTLMVVAYRIDEVPPDHVLRRLLEVESIELPWLDDRQIASLLESMAGTLPEEAVQFVQRLSEGSPFMASALLRGLVEGNVLEPSSEGWIVHTAKLRDARSSYQAGVFLAQRLERLPSEVLDFLKIGALLGSEFRVVDVAALANVEPKVVVHCLDGIRQHHVVWRDEGGQLFRFAHDKLREALLEGIDYVRRRDLHIRAGKYFEAQEPRNDFDVAYHFDAAGASERALPYAMLAAREARRRSAIDVAELQYRIAKRGCARADLDIQREISEGLADIMLLRGQYDEAESEFECALVVSNTAMARAALECKLGEVAFKRGDVGEATAATERALQTLGRFVPRRTFLLVVCLLWEVTIQALHTILPSFFLAKRAREGADEDHLAMRLYSRLAHTNWFHRGALACGWAHLRGMNLAETYPPGPELAQAYSEHAPVMTIIPYFQRGIVYVQRSLEIRRALNDVWGQGQALHFWGVILYGASRYEESIQKCRAAMTLLERTGDQWELNTASWHIAYARYRLGQLDEAVHQAQKVHQAGVVLGDRQARGISLGVWSKASEGAAPAPLIKQELDQLNDDGHTMAELLQASALDYLARGEPRHAADRLDRAWELVKSRGLRQEYVAPIPAWLATARRKMLEATPYFDAKQRRRAILAHRKIARVALRVARAYRNNLPHALREHGYAAAFAGDYERAQHAFEKSIAVAESQHARYEYAQSLVARGEVGMAAGWARAELDLIRGKHIVEELTDEVRSMHGGLKQSVRDSWSTADRFDRLLSAARDFASTRTDAEVFAILRNAGVRVLRGHRSDVFPVSGPHGAPQVDGSNDVSRSVLNEAITRRRVVTVADGLQGANYDSVVISGARSVLCAPVVVRGSVYACLYVTHPLVGALFGPMEERLASLLAVLASAALENVAGVAEAQARADEQEGRALRAREAVQARDAFISVASHELKTPVTALRLQLQMLLRQSTEISAASRRRAELEVEDGTSSATVTSSTPRANDRLATVNRQVDRLVKLVDDLLDVSRITMGCFDVQREEVDLGELVRDVMDRLDGALRSASCDVVLDLQSGVVGHWDRGRVEQVITNLVSNAVKYGAGKPVTITLTTSTGMAVLSVRDHGIGIPEEHRQQIFERFERRVSERNYGGFGLGLWIARQILELHGGSIDVTSSPGRGSTFQVQLPLARNYEAKTAAC